MNQRASDTLGRRLWFSGTYNLFDHGDESYKAPRFITTIMAGGGTFFKFENLQAIKVLVASEIEQLYTRDPSSAWIGRLILPPEIAGSLVQQFVESYAGPDEWRTRLRNWNITFQRYSDLWITLDFPARQAMSAVIVTYWNYKPDLIELSDFPAPDLPAPCSPADAANRLVDHLYVDIDNLFSAYIFEVGQFTYPENELRKLSFTYGVSVSDPLSVAPTGFDFLRPLYKKCLLVDSVDDLSASRIELGFVLTYARGFIGMTGQPRVGKSPDLQILFVKSDQDNIDRRTIHILRQLCAIEKADAQLNTIAEVHLPAVRHTIGGIAGAVRQISAKAQQVRVDIDLALRQSDLRLLNDRSELLDSELAQLLVSKFDVMGYLSQFMRTAMSLHGLTRSTKEELQVEPLHGPQVYFETRLHQVQRIGELIADCERELHKPHEETLSAQSALVGSRLALQQKYLRLSAGADTSTKEITALETCFVLMAFRKELDDIYQEIILPVFDEGRFGLRCYRADEIYGTSSIMQDVWKAIRGARLIIAELTGRNPNVLYELGISHVLRKPAILLTQTMDDVPFDLKHLRCIVYSLGPSGLRKLRADLETTIKKLLADAEREVVLLEP